MKHLLASLVLTFGAAPALAQSAAPAGDAKHGELLYMADGCYQCHGTVGQGSRGTGPRLTPNTIPYDAFAAQLRKPADIMPPYTALVVSESQLADIYAYIKSVPGPAKAGDVTILH